MALWLYGYGIAHNNSFDRKITAALAPKKEEQDGEENKQINTIDAPTTIRKSQWLQNLNFVINLRLTLNAPFDL